MNTKIPLESYLDFDRMQFRLELAYIEQRYEKEIAILHTILQHFN